MGVPKFYRWISERYPQINQIVSDSALLPEFDHLYLDMNGIIHGCTHPAHMDNINDGLSERDMMLGIMQYLDRIITQIVKPKVSVYMAIDGVAPRAKLNQQRSRRFRSAKDMAEATKDLPKSDEPGISARQIFDSNCITPGTEFLAKVSVTIQYFIRKKIKEDPAWRNLLVIFSGHDIPGEGEHKIMSHIRAMRNDPNYQPNTRHCIYGQDADLIMLGLVTHEPHFTILREVVNFNSFNTQKNTLKAVKKFTKESDFQLLHLSLLREYLQIEFAYQQSSRYDLERIVDDFVFMTFLVGNDFLPHMPTLDIGDGAFDLLFTLYKKQRDTWGHNQYLTERGEIMDPARLEVFLAAIGQEETNILEKREDDEAIYVEKKRKWDKRDGKAAGPSDEELLAEEGERQNDYNLMLSKLLLVHNVNSFVDGWTPVTEVGRKDFKGRYYFEKLSLTPIDKEQHWILRRSYVEGLIWCLAYYYKGCISWGWFYPFHYGPMLSDLTNLPKMFKEIEFDLGAPLSPFEQLMGCLPPASSMLVPKLYRWLMSSPNSPIIQFYPENFEVDMNGKKNPWEGVNLLPFIDIKLLKATIATHCPQSKLSSDEIKRNAMGKVYFYRHDLSCTDFVESPNVKIGLLDIVTSHSSVTMHDEDLGLSGFVFEPKLISGTQIPYPGFPSLNVMPITSTELVPIGLNCFGTPSKYPTMVLTMYPMPELPPIELLAQNVIGKSLFVNWPMMHEGKVVALSDSTKEIRMKNGTLQIKEHSTIASGRWLQDAESMAKMYYTGNGLPGSGGIHINEIKVRLRLLPLQGMKTNVSNGSTKKLFGNEEADVPLQLALWHAPAPDPRFIERGPLSLADRFSKGSYVVLTKGKYRGCVGSVVDVVDLVNVGVKVLTVPPEMPFGLAIARSVEETYLSAYNAARILKLSPSVFGKVTGRLQFEQGRYDLGLNLKSSDGLCVVGYTRKKVEESKGNPRSKNHKDDIAWAAGDSLLVVGSRGVNDDDGDEERITWEYTPKAVRLVEEYRGKFPQLFAAINQKPNEKRYDANQVFGLNGEAWLPVVREWLDKHESAKVPRSPVTTVAMSYEAAAAVQKAADVRSLALKKKGYPKETLIKVPGSALYREGSTGATDILLATDINNGEGPELGDRIVNLCADGVPFGMRGTVIGVHEAATSGSVEVVMDAEFIGGTSLQGHCANFRGKLCHWSQLLKIAPDNSKGLVDKLVPQDCKDAATSLDTDRVFPESIAESSLHLTSSWDSQVDRSEEKYVDSTISSSISKAKTKTTNRSTPSNISSGRTRQGVWREARGPSENGKKSTGSSGFIHDGKSGLARWRDMNLSKTDAELIQVASHLKEKLNVSSESNASDEYRLKSILGLTESATSVKPATEPSSNITNELKAMLGVAAELSPSSYNFPHQNTPVSAAEKLQQIMSKNRQKFVPPSTFSSNQFTTSPFNFTYIEEGKEVPLTLLKTSQRPSHHLDYESNGLELQIQPGLVVNSYLQPPVPAHTNFSLNSKSFQVLPNSDFPPLGCPVESSQRNIDMAGAKSNNDASGSLVPSAVKFRGSI